MVERIRRHTEVRLDPHIAHAGLVYNTTGRQVLEDIYRSYIDIGQRYNVPFITLAPTWRANPERIRQSAYASHKSINADCVQLMKEIRTSYGDYASSIFVCGLMGCKGDAYLPQEALSTEEATVFHGEQAQALAESGVDCIKAPTLPALSEALGIAAAISPLQLPYILSFVIRGDGTLLDGTPLHQAIQEIDSKTNRPPLFYMINCVHPTIFTQAFIDKNNRSRHVLDRILGFQANTSALSPEELENLDHLDTSDPNEFAEQMTNIHRDLGIKVVGGCCGSDDRHVSEIAHRLCQ